MTTRVTQAAKAKAIRAIRRMVAKARTTDRKSERKHAPLIATARAVVQAKA